MATTLALPSPAVDPLTAPVAARIRLARRERRMTVTDLARIARLRTATVRRLESGERRFSAALAGRVAHALGIDEEELYPGGRPDRYWAGVATAMRRQGVRPGAPLAVAA